MQEKLQTTLAALGSTEKSLVEEQYGADLRRWAQLFDQVSSRPDVLATFGDSGQTDFQNLVSDMDAILADISRLDMIENASSLEHVKNRMISFKNSGYQRLLDVKNRVQAVELDTTNLEAMKRVLDEARQQADEFKKSFADSLQKQVKGSTRTLERHFKEKIQELKKDDLTSPRKWQEKRDRWFWILVVGTLALSAAYAFLMVRWSDFSKYAIQIAAAKLVLLGLAYLQYNFSTRNYHIAADQIAHYEQQEVVAKTLTDFVATATQDSVLKEHILSNASKTLFAEIKTGHLKDRSKDGSVVENVINQFSKTE